MSILYTNGSSHSAAAYATNNYKFAADDRTQWAQARRPHPANLAVSWSSNLSSLLKMSLYTDAEGDRSNQMIIDSTKEWIATSKADAFMIIEFAPENLEMLKEFHLYLNEKNYKHVFFNGAGAFQLNEDEQYDFGSSYINPYLVEASYTGQLDQLGHMPVITSNEFFGGKAHSAWTKVLIKHIMEHKLV